MTVVEIQKKRVLTVVVTIENCRFMLDLVRQIAEPEIQSLLFVETILVEHHEKTL